MVNGMGFDRSVDGGSRVNGAEARLARLLMIFSPVLSMLCSLAKNRDQYLPPPLTVDYFYLRVSMRVELHEHIEANVQDI